MLHKMFKFVGLIVSLSLIYQTNCLQNGLSRTPPMGWLSWERFRCITDCKNYPDECISEKLFKQHADLMASEGYKEAGYEYVIIDDCWLANERGPDGRLQADSERFPNGIKALAEYVHSKGLKFGIYEDYGTKTCAGYPGSFYNLKLDAETFADWDVDYVKMDGCYAELSDLEDGFGEFSEYLNGTGRPIVFSCCYPFYQETNGIKSNYEKAKNNCNSWRNHIDVQDSWESVSGIIKYFVDNQDRFIPVGGPGHWNDPDMLIIGNYGLSIDQSRAQMAIWAILASPLIMSHDLRSTRPEFKDILLNKDVIAINQDSLGVHGRMVLRTDDIEIFTKPIQPVISDNHSYAIAFLSHRTDGSPYAITITLKDIGLNNGAGYNIENIYDKKSLGTVNSSDSLSVRVNPTGVVLLKATVLKN